MMPNFKKYNHPNLINKKIMSKPKKKKKKKKKEWEQKKHLTRLLKPRKANEKRRIRKEREQKSYGY